MRDFAYVLTLASGFTPAAPADAPARDRAESTPAGETPRAPATPRPAPTARSRSPAARARH